MDQLVSIVLPVYNGEQYLRESIDSVLAQTYTNWELLILDDGSTDQTAAIADEYVRRDSRIHYYRNPQNLRLPRNLNRGFRLSRGQYLTWTSDDNRYKPTAIERMVRALEDHPTAQFVFASCRIIDENGVPFEYITVNKNSLKSIVGSDSVGACFLYTREVYETVGDYDPDFKMVEDFDYWQRIFAKFHVTIIEDYLYEYRLHRASLTGTRDESSFQEILEKMLLKNRPAFGKLTAEENYYYYKGLYLCRVRRNAKENPYKWNYRYYASIYFLCHRVPKKLRRIFHR